MEEPLLWRLNAEEWWNSHKIKTGLNWADTLFEFNCKFVPMYFCCLKQLYRPRTCQGEVVTNIMCFVYQFINKKYRNKIHKSISRSPSIISLSLFLLLKKQQQRIKINNSIIKKKTSTNKTNQKNKFIYRLSL